MCSAIAHFQVPNHLTVKIRRSAQLVLGKWVLFTWDWKFIPISKAEHVTSFWYRVPGNSEMAFYFWCRWWGRGGQLLAIPSFPDYTPRSLFEITLAQFLVSSKSDELWWEVSTTPRKPPFLQWNLVMRICIVIGLLHCIQPGENVVSSYTRVNADTESGW